MEDREEEEGDREEEGEKGKAEEEGREEKTRWPLPKSQMFYCHR